MGAPENTLIKDMEMSNELLSNFIQKEESFFPKIDIDTPNKNSISFLRKKGIHIAPITKSSNLLYLSSYNYHEFIEEDITELKDMIERHVNYTKSTFGFEVLNDWSENEDKFVKVMPRDYRKMLSAFKRVEERGLTGDEAELTAFREAMAEEA